MSTLRRIRKIALAATVAAAALSAPATQGAAPAITDLGSMLVTAERNGSVADLGSMTVIALRDARVANLGTLTVLAHPAGDSAIAYLGRTTVTAPRLVTVAGTQASRRPAG